MTGGYEQMAKELADAKAKIAHLEKDKEVAFSWKPW